ncbi:chromate resistance protein ChrB domain-containing protein [Sediminibacterium soli]|uniref:chromate resistance protein ChrB domain-containing protein n=1 Tax=Sediminibacterium soli TaxID=2698829 RepID=UPI001379B6CB|nr:chromate resistance protein ChrB domain-containing protein [Sediminibacterium soli]NCI48233.1 helix-turn-helix domain-containing protein [Sediminibacterium soli]
MKWITRERPKIDRIACPWLIRRFIDSDAEILYVPSEEVLRTAKKLKATPFDIAGVEYTHYDDKCTFDFFLKRHKLKDPALDVIAAIVRGADTDRHDIAAQASGLWAVSAGLAHNFTNDYELLDIGMRIYDALYSWAKHHYREKHIQQPGEQLLIDVYDRFLKQKKKTGKQPPWVKELRELIQDQVDASITLKEVSKGLDINPAYLSREFSKYFDNLSFGEYIRMQRIEKAIGYLVQTAFPLTKIAYLTGFSDQSHFTRVFKKITGQNPSAYRKKVVKK